MSFGNIIGQLLQKGMAGQTETRGRLQQAAGQSGGGLDQMLGSLLGGGGAGAGGARASSPAGSAGGLGNLAGLAEQFLGNKQVGGMTGAQAGGLGALVGAVLGGGGGAAKGAVGGGAMAILGTLALTALKNYQAGASASAAAAPSARLGEAPPAAPEEVRAVTAPATEKLMVRAMISAAKADGSIDKAEMERIAGQIDTDGVTDAERQFVIDELTRPLDLRSLVADVDSPAVAAEVYAASILAIDIDTEEERQYLRDLAHGLKLDAGTVQRLHQMTGAPTV